MSRDILLTLIDADPNQPRRHFEPDALQELADSLKANGQIVPITVRTHGDRYIIVQGERRYRAAQLAGLSSLRAEVVEIGDDEAYWLALVENVQRADLSPIEEAHAYQRLLDAGHTQAALGKRIGKTQSYIAQKLRLLKLPDCLKVYLAAGALSEGHMRQLMRLRGVYGEDITEALNKGEDPESLLKHRQITVIAFSLSMRPLSEPVGGVICRDDDRELDLHYSATKSFLLQTQNTETPVWLRVALWYAMIAAHCSISVADLAKMLDGFTGCFYSAIIQSTMSQPFSTEREEWKIHHQAVQSDLRHAGLTIVHDRLFARAFKHVYQENEGLMWPTQLQPWGAHADVAQKLSAGA